MPQRRHQSQNHTGRPYSRGGERKTPKKEEPNVVGEVKIGNCNYNVVVSGDPKGEHEVELVGTSCDLRADATKSTEVIDAIFNAKRVIYTPPQKFLKEEA